jgi:hypothetical protein
MAASGRFIFAADISIEKMKWLPDQGSNLDEPVNSRVAYQLADREKLVEHLGIEPSPACLQSMPADPARAPILRMVPGIRIERIPSVFQTAAMTTSATRAKSGADQRNRTTIIARAARGTPNIPGPQIMVGNPGIEPGRRIGAGFTGPLSPQTWRYPDFHWISAAL